MYNVSGFYIINDSYFTYLNESGLVHNKFESRPHYFCIQINEIYWMIPMSSQVSKYQQIMDTREKENKPNDILHIARLDDGNESVFLIGNMIPVSEIYIKREYTISGNHFKVTSEHLEREVLKKANKIRKLLERGIILTENQPNVMEIINKIKNDPNNV